MSVVKSYFYLTKIRCRAVPCQPISGPRFRRDARSFELRGSPSPSSTRVPLTLNDPFWYGMLVSVY